MQPPEPALGGSSQASSLARRFELAVPFVEEDLAQVIPPVSRRDVGQGAVQSDVIVVLDVGGHTALRFVEAGRAGGSDAFPLAAAVPAFKLAVGLVTIHTPERNARRTALPVGSGREGMIERCDGEEEFRGPFRLCRTTEQWGVRDGRSSARPS